MTRFILLAILAPLAAQDIYDLLLKGGQVIDPRNKRNERLDIAVAGGKVRKIARGIPSMQARRVVDLSDYIVTPGLIDLQANFGPNGVNPDHNELRNGVTTAVDAGSTGAKSFEAFRKTVIAESKTRVLAFLNTAEGPVADMQKRYPAIIAGAQGTNDAFHFRFKAAVPAVRSGRLPETIATGMDRRNLLLPRATMTNVMSKYMAMGMTLEQVIERTTVKPANAIHRPELGTLEEGGIADIAVFEIRKGKVGFLDTALEKFTADRELRCVLTVRDGRVVWDSEGLSLTHWRDAGPYSNFK
ncbi:MAG: amidohydrolase family protein [Acidobacteria bacterium]|nr:amidohydrolase family protein [Acidobacteriota bacterium]